MRSLIYLLAGVALGLLIAPETGAEMRKKSVDVFSDAKQDAKDLAAQTADDVKAFVAEA